jgi:hypothetical protein
MISLLSPPRLTLYKKIKYMSHQLIGITTWPSMPAPFDSEDDGEAWIWGDYVALLQKNPRTCNAVMIEMMNHISKNSEKLSSRPSAMEYPYAMIVFYKKHRNPHGPSSQPILCVGIERANYGSLKTMLGDFSGGIEGLPADGKGPMMVGVFTSENRLNLGELDDFLTLDTAREKFFKVVKSQLEPEGLAKYIGGIRSIHGHPETGWPAAKEKPKKTGCLGIFLLMAILLPGIFAVFNQMM